MNSCALLNSYCSRFPDTDAPFGSKGSFFDYEADEGVFESNPPFVEECMIRNIKHILDLLEKAEKSGKALTFFIIVPKWDEKDCESYNLTRFTTPDRQTDEENQFFICQCEMSRNSHFYRNGMGYQDDFSVMAAKNDSLMLVLQTAKAKEANPIDVEAFKKEVEERWNKSSEEYIRNALSGDKRSYKRDYSDNEWHNNRKWGGSDLGRKRSREDYPGGKRYHHVDHFDRKRSHEDDHSSRKRDRNEDQMESKRARN